MEEFTKDVKQIRENIEKIQTNVDEVKKFQRSISSAPQTNDKDKQQLERLMADIKRTAIIVKDELKEKQQNLEQPEKTSMIPLRTQPDTPERSNTNEVFKEMLESEDLAIFTERIEPFIRESKQTLEDIEKRKRIQYQAEIRKKQIIIAISLAIVSILLIALISGVVGF